MGRLGLADATRLIAEGSEVLGRIEANGFRIDVPYLERMADKTAAKIRDIEEDLRSAPEYAVWRRRYGADTNLGSNQQLGQVLYNDLGFPVSKRTDTGLPKTDEEAFQDIDLPFLRRWQSLERLKRMRSTNIIGILREQVNGFLHTVYNLNLVVTYRSSSTDPNMQNIPNRDPKQAKIIRRAFIPRSEEYFILEADYSAAEVRVAACYHQDPTMIRYIEENHDLHRDMAAECFDCAPDQVSKPMRGLAKGGFVFASFYGDWYLQICQNLWGGAMRDKLCLADGTSVMDHLAARGIRSIGGLDPKEGTQPGTYEHLIKEVHNRFWDQRFPVYRDWKEAWWQAYLKTGAFQMLTGFVYRGVAKRNEVINAGIQGSAFHCLLWSLIQIQRWLDKHRLQSKIIGQVHDSILMDVHRAEADDVLPMVKQIMTQDIRRAWDWLIVPMESEFEVGETNWYEKHEVRV